MKHTREERYRAQRAALLWASERFLRFKAIAVKWDRLEKWIKPAGALLLAVVLCVGGPVLEALGEEEPFWEETVFLGEAVPLRIGEESLEELLRGEFPEEGGRMECWWMSPQGQRTLEALGKERPKEDTDYHLSAVLHREGAKDSWLNMTYRVYVVKGTVRVRAAGFPVQAGHSVLFRLESEDLTLFRRAWAEADPQGGAVRLEAEFTGLPFGIYKVSALEGGAREEEAECRLGLCRENDTIDPGLSTAVVEFTLNQAGQAIGESFRLGGGQ